MLWNRGATEAFGSPERAPRGQEAFGLQEDSAETERDPGRLAAGTTGWTLDASMPGSRRVLYMTLLAKSWGIPSWSWTRLRAA